MATSSRRVVITGIGIVNPLGSSTAAFWDGVQKGQSGVRPIQAFDTRNLSTRFAGEIVDFEPKSYIEKKERKSLRIMARGIQLAVAAAQAALDDGKVDKAALDPTRFGCEFGAGLLPTELDELAAAAKVSANCQPGNVDMKIWGEQGLPAIPPLWMLKYLPNMLACHVSILHNAQGPNNSITESDVAGLLALAESFRILRRDQADFFLVGGADSKINPLSMVRQCMFGHLSKRNDAPAKASRPFDRHRDGLVIGEGGGVLVVEDLEHARKRGGSIYAEVLGVGAAFARGCKGDGLVRAIKAALRQAGVEPGDIDHINAHGLSLPQTDAWEAQSLRDAFAGNPPPVLGAKSYFGHLGAGGGTTELGVSLLGMKQGTIPATLNFEEADPNCPVPVIREPRQMTRPHVLKIGFNDMGQCAAIVCRRWQD